MTVITAAQARDCGLPCDCADTGAMRPATEARDIIASQFDALFPGRALPWAAHWILLAQSRQEGQWGAFGGLDAEGNYGGENWGAVQAKMGPPCPAGTFEAGDSRPTSTGQKPFRWCFVAYPTAADGARDFLRHALVLRAAALAPLLAGDVWNYARILREQNYYGGFSTTTGEGELQDKQRRWEQIASYVDMIDAQGAEVHKALSLPVPPRTKKPPRPGGPLGGSTVQPKKPGRPLGWVVSLVAAIPLILRK